MNTQKNKKKLLPIGSGLSWFDTIFNTNNILINLNKFNKKFIFNKTKGELTVSAGYKIFDIVKKINLPNWSLYSIPGGGDVSIGGCIGNDVHGKDSFKFGNFSENIIEMEVVLPNKKIIKCSKNKNLEIFRSVSGGLGLIGIVTEVKLKLKKSQVSIFHQLLAITIMNLLQIFIRIMKNLNI